ncbi:hypothetical protein ABT124_39000 [Streptomyces sp. NPDC001982]|uniref:hypothetical protein n=1 Tax=Streptomyces sp. NPDC001982 TaxID=3154405 RepID=UPI00333022F4
MSARTGRNQYRPDRLLRHSTRGQGLGQFRERDDPPFQHDFGLRQLGTNPVRLGAQLLHTHPGSRLPSLQQPHHRRHLHTSPTKQHDVSSLPQNRRHHA